MNDRTEMNSDPMTGYVMAPTPPEIADHIERWEKLRDAGVLNGVPSCPVEWHAYSVGGWVPLHAAADWWLEREGKDRKRRSVRLVPLPSLPPSPEMVVVVDANTAHALIGRRVKGLLVATVLLGGTGQQFVLRDRDSVWIGGWRNWGESVSLDPLPAPPPEEEVETVTVVLAALHEAMQTYRGFRGDDTLAADAAHLARWMDESYDRLRAALAAEGGE